ncbi:uncharacterized protein TNIN_409261 [Trichonephila inaurata madagascariensis]|uniref:Uncharacterized protein n=1 Tax=Trichonephila inaurata madagascariensis TaxID=2747483 RepID=A0A8X6X6E4_9ARAC|nr:uncharacterized protein TNIN_409261 [Trichonephila inaurata madagascariensis]
MEWLRCSQKSMAEYFLEDQTLEKWSSIEESLKLKIGNCLILPNELKIVLSSLVDPMGGHAKKTAESAIKDDNLPVTKRYEIACIYCLKEEIIMLWSELSETSKDEYLNPRRPVCALRYLAMYWTYSMRLELNRLDRRIREEYNAQLPSYYVGLYSSSVTNNQPALEYFTGKLSVEKKEEFWKLYFRYTRSREELNIYFCDTSYFLLSQMNENQRTSIFEEYAYYILKNFLQFPYGGDFFGN